MRFNSSSFDYLVETVLILILFSDAVQAGRNRASAPPRHPPSYRSATPRSVSSDAVFLSYLTEDCLVLYLMEWHRLRSLLLQKNL